MPRKCNWVWSCKSWLFTERGLGFQIRISKRDPISGPSGLESSAFFNPLWLHWPTEQSHCGSVVLVVAELQHFFGIQVNMNAKNSTAKRETQLNFRWRTWRYAILYYAHALSCTEHMSRKRIWSLKWQTKTKKKKLAIYRSWPWNSNYWEWDSNSGLSGIGPRALTTRPRRLGANLPCLLFLNQSVLADFNDRKKNNGV